MAIANSGTFREAAEKMYVSQPSLSISVRDLEKELGFKIFRRTSSGTFLTRRGMEFYEKAQDVVKGFDIFQNQYASPEEEKKEFLYFLVNTMTSCHHLTSNSEFDSIRSSWKIRKNNSASLSQRRSKFWMKWLKGIVSWGLFISTVKIPRELCNGLIN